MPEVPDQRRVPLIPVGMGILLVAVGLFVILRRGHDTGPLPVPAGCFNEMVSHFYSGTVALIVQDPDRPEPELKRATECAPEEPAPWANLALYYLRGRTRIDQAESAIKKARENAPPNSQIEAIYGHLENTRGSVDRAVAHFQKAVELDSRNIHARWVLADLLERQRAPGYEAEVQKQVEGILSVSPDNLVALTRLGTMAARKGDKAATKNVVDSIDRQSAGWSANVKSMVAELRAPQSDSNSTMIKFLQLSNLLKPESRYQKSQAELTPPDKAIGIPLERFVRLPSPTPHPAPADVGMTFGAPEELVPNAPSGALPSPAARVMYLQLSPEITPNLAESFKIPAAAEISPSTLLVSGKAIQVISPSRTAILPFPGGPNARAPSPNGLVAADLNYDFRPDLVAAGAGGLQIYQQAADGVFKEVTAAAKLPAEVIHSPAYGVWIADIDLDGDLDVVVGYPQSGTRVLRNNGDGTFKSVNTFESVPALRGFVWADFDGDGDPDPVFLDSRGNITLLSNERSGRFLPRALPSIPAVAAIAAADMDRDLSVDLVILQSDGTVTRISDQDDGASWAQAQIARGSAVTSAPGDTRLFLADLDNNGGLDILAAGPGAAQAWLADDKGGFAALPGDLGSSIQAVGDTDSNGLLDLIGLGAQGSPVVRRNQSKAGYQWLDLRPRATFVQRADPRSGSGDSRVSSFGIGGEVEARSALLVQKQVIAGPSVHFGLGKNPKVDYARFTWPNGSVQGEFALNANQSIVTVQRLKGSCPWLFAWNGRSMAFVTDVLWKSPLGLRINAQNTAGVMTTLDWVRVRGDQLAPRDGYYDLRVTAELWETHFFDQVALMVVDHPADVDVFVDERFAFPPPPVRLNPVSPPRPLVRAVDDLGNDVTGILRSQDGHYLDTFGRGQYQGITRDHFVEVEIPARAAETGNICLVGFGWVHPTDSSINVAISQGRHPAPTGISIEIPVDNTWRAARTSLGFPAGKNKNVLLDLSDILKQHPGTTRFRLKTNLELYWDSIRWAEWKPQAAIVTKTLLPEQADLSYRGFSVASQVDSSSPEIPDYDRIATRAQLWRDLIGYYTRFGDVRELLNSVDDRYVILNAGDEMAFRFRAQPPPPAGWTRDYVFVSDGWEKDGDYNTGFSKTVLPLPAHDDPDYNRPPRTLADDPVYRRHPEDWRRFHTRWVSTKGFRGLLRAQP